MFTSVCSELRLYNSLPALPLSLSEMSNKLASADNQTRALHKAFEMFDRDGNGTICLKEFSAVLRSLHGFEPSEREVKKVLNQFDKNKDGVIDLDEFIEMALSFKGYREVEEEPNEFPVLQKLFDTEEDLMEAFRKFDVDGDGFISPEELRIVVCTTGEKLTDEEADELIKMFDTNDDGQLSWEEFVEFVKANRPPDEQE